MLKVANKISIFFFIRIISLLALIFVAWGIYNHKFSIIDTKVMNQDVSQFIELKGLDEYTLASLVTSEKFTIKVYNLNPASPKKQASIPAFLCSNFIFQIRRCASAHVFMAFDPLHIRNYKKLRGFSGDKPSPTLFPKRRLITIH